MMNRNYIYILIALCITTLAGLNSCKKPISFSAGNLSFSQDTVIFDTVFTTVGSTTKQLKIYNDDSKTLRIDQIVLEGGTASPFRINVDGSPGTNFSGIEMEGNDSLFIFVEVTLDPNNGTTPLVIEDRIRFTTNGVDQYVELVAWGQDAYFHVSLYTGDPADLDINSGTWPNDKPHVIYGGAYVDSATTLTIQAGTDIYLHKNAVLYNYKGTLNIEGTLGNEVTLQGDRLEASYDDVAGQYFGIYFKDAQPSTINYAIIKNGTSGIHIDGEDPANGGAYTVEVSNTKVDNCSSYGLMLTRGGRVKAENTVISRSGVHGFFNFGGTAFNFNHCTLVGYSNGDTPAVGIGNYYIENQTAYILDIVEGTITNSAIYGNQAYELAFDTLNGSNMTLDFQYNDIKSDDIFTDAFYQNNLWNQEPYFKETNGPDTDFSFWSMSLLRDAGDGSISNTLIPSMGIDINGVSRPSGTQVDIGAYEY